MFANERSADFTRNTIHAMDIFMWILVGGIVGGAGYSYLGVNEHRGIVVSAVIGALGGVLGGQMLAPLFITPGTAAVPGDFNASALFFAAAAAAAFLALGDLVYRRWRM